MFRVFADSLVCLHFIMVNYWNERASKRDREFEKGLLKYSLSMFHPKGLLNQNFIPQCFPVGVLCITSCVNGILASGLGINM